MPFLLQVYIDSPIILNGVCLRWKGYINLEKLDGVGGMKFDEDSARVSRFYSQFCAAWKFFFPDWRCNHAAASRKLQARFTWLGWATAAPSCGTSTSSLGFFAINIDAFNGRTTATTYRYYRLNFYGFSTFFVIAHLLSYQN